MSVGRAVYTFNLEYPTAEKSLRNRQSADGRVLNFKRDEGGRDEQMG